MVQGRADEDLLDSYQAERELHVRAIISTAIAMGRVVCLLDEAAAAARNRDMLARKASGAQDVSVAYPDLSGGALTDTPRAGALFPQPIAANGARFDDLLGQDAVLVGRGLPPVDGLGLRSLDLGGAALAPFAPVIDGWLEAAGASAVLIRPDRHVFGTGEPRRLLELWREAAASLLAA